MPTIVIASTNPVKIRAAKQGFARMFPHIELKVVSVSVESGVANQPQSDQETFTGALNRVNNARLVYPDADYWIGIEGGVATVDDELAAFAWVVVRSQHRVGKARTGTFFLPNVVAQLVHEGKELGEADDIVFQRQNSKQENGAVGILTGNVVDRIQLYEQTVVLACIPHKNEGLYG